MSKEWSFNGKTYPSLAKLVEAEATNGNSYSCVATRIKKGWDLAKALAEPPNKNTQRSYVINGVEYKNLKALAEGLKITYHAAVKRAHRGWTEQEFVHGKEKKAAKAVVPKEKSIVGNPIEVGGVLYGNMRIAFDKLQPSCKYNTLRKRLHEGWIPDEAFELIPRVDGRSRRAKKIVVGGESYSLEGAALKFGLSAMTISTRLKRGASPEQAVGLQEIRRGELKTLTQTLATPRKKTVYCVDGVNYSSVTALAKAYNLPYPLVYNRIRDNKWDAERAVKEKISESVIVNGIEYRSALNAHDMIGQKTLATFNARKLKGFSLEVCLGLEPLPPLQRYDLNGKVYNTLSEVAEDYDLSVSTLTARLYNMSLEEAVVFKPMNGRYSAVVFARDPELANTAGTFYFVRISLNDGILHKVGITKREAVHRFAAYQVEVICEVKGRMIDLHNLEQRVLAEFADLHYRAEEEFDGRTETFQLMDEEEQEMLVFIQENAEALL